MWSMWQPCMTTAYLVGTFMIETTVLLLCHLWSNNLPGDQSVHRGREGVVQFVSPFILGGMCGTYLVLVTIHCRHTI